MASKDLKDYREDDLFLIRKYCLKTMKKKDASDKTKTDAARLLAKVHDALTKGREDRGSKLPKELQDILDGGDLKDDRMNEIASTVPNAPKYTTP